MLKAKSGIEKEMKAQMQKFIWWDLEFEIKMAGFYVIDP